MTQPKEIKSIKELTEYIHALIDAKEYKVIGSKVFEKKYRLALEEMERRLNLPKVD